VCGTLPDLDVLYPYPDAVTAFTYHRSVSHSLFVLAALTPFVVRLIGVVHPATRDRRLGWYALVALVFTTHVLLDCFTVYGTQVLWPLATTPVAWSTLFIIDPLYTLPLLAGVSVAALSGPGRRSGHRANALGLALSSLYLAWSLGAKLHVEDLAERALARQGVAYERLLTMPGPFNTLLWRVLAMTDGGYVEGFYSMADGASTLGLRHYPSRRELLQGLEGHRPVARLQWFTKGFYGVSAEGGDLVITDLRMGIDPDYVFRFKVAEAGNPHAVPTPAERVASHRDLRRLRWVWERIWDPSAGEPRAEGRRAAGRAPHAAGRGAPRASRPVAEALREAPDPSGQEPLDPT
jgi:inner membrane protein